MFEFGVCPKNKKHTAFCVVHWLDSSLKPMSIVDNRPATCQYMVGKLGQPSHLVLISLHGFAMSSISGLHL